MSNLEKVGSLESTMSNNPEKKQQTAADYLTLKGVQNLRIHTENQSDVAPNLGANLILSGAPCARARAKSEETEQLSVNERRAVEVCIQQLKGWTKFEVSRCTVAALSGGLTNIIWLVRAPEGALGIEHRAVVIRQFGAGTEAIIDRDQEAQIYKVFADVGVGPKILGFFQGGRIEEFFPATRILCKDLKEPNQMTQIATMLGKIHKADGRGLKGRDAAGQSLIADLRSWADKAALTEFPTDEVQAAALANLQFDEVLEEMEVLIDALEAIKSKIVLCHNDLHEGNILINDGGSGKLYLIDFEYAGWGPRGYDLGNHFCEMSVDNFAENSLGFKYSPSDYPKREQQDLFFSKYLQAQGQSLADKDFQKEMERLFIEANMYALLSHFKWGLWGIACAATSDIEFDFLAFAQTRMNAYYERKAACTRLKLWPEASSELEARLEVLRRKKLKWKVATIGLFSWGAICSGTLAMIAFHYRKQLSEMNPWFIPNKFFGWLFPKRW